MNKVILRGNLTRDPELRTVKTGDKTISVVNFTLAVSRYFKKNNGDKDQDTTFIACEAWDTGAETIAKYLYKGSPLLIEGSLKNESWEQDGQKRSRMKVRILQFEMLGGKRNNSESDSESSNEQKPPF